CIAFMQVAAQQYTQKAHMLTKRYRICAAQVSGKVYVFGGVDQNGIINKTEVYDPVSDAWTTKANMPHGVRDAAACAMNGKIYVIGGWGLVSGGLSGPTDYVQEYDPVANSWTL